MAITMPPYQTHQTSGLKLRRISAWSGPIMPENTRYTSCIVVSYSPTSVLGSNVGWSLLSTCCRFSLLNTCIGRPSRVTARPTAVT